jgi:aldehyde dehydrogenase (NAD+)
MSVIKEIFERQKKHKNQLKQSSAYYRVEKLKKLKEAIIDKSDSIKKALFEDFKKPDIETDLTEILPVISALNLLIKELELWMLPEKVKTPLLFTGTSSEIRYEPKGNVLVISPWNYPFHLAIYPVMTSFAAGNTTILKPSEYTPQTNKIICEIFANIFSDLEVAIVEGEQNVSEELLTLSFDHIFFTGSCQVGQVVMKAATQNMCGVTLELGGKCPVIVDVDYDVKDVARKIVWGKFINAGQTCVAPDYVLIAEEIKEKFYSEIEKVIDELYSSADDLAGIISEKHFKRLKDLISDAQAKGATLRVEGKIDEKNLKIFPTVVVNTNQSMKISKEEIFGPILPIITVKNLDEMIHYVNQAPHPLASYIFSKNKKNIEKILNETNSGGVTINDVVLHIANPHLPFGGVGASGLGKYHGRFGFEELTHKRAVLKRDFNAGTQYFYPPFNDSKKSLVKNLLKKISSIF